MHVLPSPRFTTPNIFALSLQNIRSYSVAMENVIGVLASADHIFGDIPQPQASVGKADPSSAYAP